MKTMKIGVVLLALLLAGMAMVPMVSAEVNSADLQKQETIVKEWQENHKIKVTNTITSIYKNGILETETLYSGNAFKERFGIENFKIVSKVPIDSKNAEKLGLKENVKKVSSKETTEVFTLENDPPMTFSTFSYPRWIYEKSGNVYHQLDEPTNMIWTSNTIANVESELWQHAWYRVFGPWFEDTYYIYDGSWKADSGMATDPYGVFGRYHIRTWQLSNGDVIGAAHHDSNAPHHADGFETAEDYIGGLYQNPDDIHWHVTWDYFWLYNRIVNPNSDGWATRIAFY